MVAACGFVALAGAAIYYGSEGMVKGLSWELTIVSLLGLMGVGIFRFHRGGRLGWAAIWLGLTSAFVGGFITAHPRVVPFDVISPSVADVLRLANYPLGAAGVLVLLFRADQRIGRRALLEAAIAIGAGSILIWNLVIDPMVASTTQSGLPLLVSLLYPFGDILLLGVLAVLLVHLSSSPGSMLLIAMALAGNLAADVAFSYQSLHGGYESGGLIDVGWLLCFASLALAPSWPTVDRLRPVGDDGGLDMGSLVFLAVGALLSPVLALADVVAGKTPDAELLVAAVALFALVLVRVVVFNRDLDTSRCEAAELARRLGESVHDLEQARSNQRRLLDRMHRVVEEERTRIAAELHDRPLQHLAGIGYQLERVTLLLTRGDHEAASGVCDRAADQLADQLGEMRALMTEIRPPVLDERGLVGALRDRAAKVQADHPGLEVSVEGGSRRADRDVETALYRVAQEALQNVVRHAAATAVSITVTCSAETIVLSVSDNGRGMGDVSRTDLLRSGRFGVAGMSERVELLGGSMTISDRRPSGTTIRFQLPTSPDPTMLVSLIEVSA